MTATTRKEIRSRKAVLARHEADSVGVCIFVSATELRSLGINPDDQAAIVYELQPAISAIKITPENERSEK